MSLELRVDTVDFQGAEAGHTGLNVVEWGGLLGGMTSRMETVLRNRAHGVHDAPTYLPGRTVPVSGWCSERTFDRLAWQQARVTGLQGRPKVRVVATEGGRTLWADAKVMEAEFEPSGGFAEGQWKLELFFPNPRSYGESHRFPESGVATSLTAYHYGNFPCSPVLSVHGDMPGYTVTANGRQYVVTRPVSTNHPHTIDMRTGYLYQDGSRVLGGTALAVTTAIPPGAQVTFTLTPSSGPVGGMSLVAYDTFI